MSKSWTYAVALGSLAGSVALAGAPAAQAQSAVPRGSFTLCASVTNENMREFFTYHVRKQGATGRGLYRIVETGYYKKAKCSDRVLLAPGTYDIYWHAIMTAKGRNSWVTKVAYRGPTGTAIFAIPKNGQKETSAYPVKIASGKNSRVIIFNEVANVRDAP